MDKIKNKLKPFRYVTTKTTQFSNAELYLSVAVLKHYVFRFKVPVYDLVFVQILNAISWNRRQ